MSYRPGQLRLGLRYQILCRQEHQGAYTRWYHIRGHISAGIHCFGIRLIEHTMRYPGFIPQPSPNLIIDCPTVNGDPEMRLDTSITNGHRMGSFSNPTEGRIAKNILQRGLRCAHGNRYKKAAEALGLPVHGAGQPLSVAEFLIRWLTEEGDVVCDPFGGRLITSLAAEMLGRLWITGERALQYVRGGAELFRDCPGFHARSLSSGYNKRSRDGSGSPDPRARRKWGEMPPFS